MRSVLAGAVVIGLCLAHVTHAGLFVQYRFDTPNAQFLLEEANASQDDAIFGDSTGAVTPTYSASPRGNSIHLSSASLHRIDLNVDTDGVGSNSGTLPESLEDNMTVAYWLRFGETDTVYMPLVEQGTNRSGSAFSPPGPNSLFNALKGATTNVDGDYTQRYFYNAAEVDLTGTGDGDPDALLDSNTWYHLAWSVSYTPDSSAPADRTMGSRIEKVFVNGQLVDSETFPGALEFNSFAAARFSYDPLGTSGPWFDGDLDQLEIYNTALTNGEVAALVPEPVSMSFLVGYVSLFLCGRRRSR